jgi:hypothetical protein
MEIDRWGSGKNGRAGVGDAKSRYKDPILASGGDAVRARILSDRAVAEIYDGHRILPGQVAPTTRCLSRSGKGHARHPPERLAARPQRS